jgi:4-amino-4-deoxy-L-arabinose transferase-like glycosyltransferase
MPRQVPAIGIRPGWRQPWPEVVLAAVAIIVFLACLGSVELWGKREQRAAAEAIDTVDHHHWLVAWIQGRPRLEKPPLPRWIIAGLILLTGRRDEWIVRLPGAVCALAMVGLTYQLGRRIGGHLLGQASGFILCSFPFFVIEARQASNDVPLALLTTLALYAAWCRLHGEAERPEKPLQKPGRLSSRGWSLIFYLALALGVLTKGPIILVLVGVTLIPYLVSSRNTWWALGRLGDGWGLALFAVIALSWPVAVLIDDPNALHVWLVEMSEKTGLWQLLPHRRHAALAAQWPGLIFPWSAVALTAAVLPFLPDFVDTGRTAAAHGQSRWLSSPWFPWWWAMGNLGMFSFWAVAKPNYYLPCLPGMAVLIGAAWIRLGRLARGLGRRGLFARLGLQAQWLLILAGTAIAPLVVRPWVVPSAWPWTLVIALVIGSSVFVSILAWRRGAEGLCLPPISVAIAVGSVIAYGAIAPTENTLRGHRRLADSISRTLPQNTRQLMFFSEIDEGLWFYLDRIQLIPVPGTQPHYNAACDLVASYRARGSTTETLAELDAHRQSLDKQCLIDWLNRRSPGRCYLLIRNTIYERLAGDLGSRVTPLYCESGVKRNGLTLLRVAGEAALTAAPSASTRR